MLPEMENWAGDGSLFSTLSSPNTGDEDSTLDGGGFHAWSRPEEKDCWICGGSLLNTTILCSLVFHISDLFFLPSFFIIDDDDDEGECTQARRVRANTVF